MLALRRISGLLLVFLLIGSAAVTAADVTLTFAVGPEDTVLVQYAKEYERLNPGVRIEIEAWPNREALLTRFAGGVPPDIFRTTEALPFILNAHGQIAPIPEHIAERMRETFYPAAIEGVTVDGKILAVPNWANVTGMWYDKQLLAEKGVAEIPTQWDEFADLARKITEYRDGEPLPPVATIPEVWALGRVGLAIILSEGGDLLYADDTIGLNDPPAVRALNKMIDAVQNSRWLDVSWRGSRVVREPSERVAFSFGFNYFPRDVADARLDDLGAAVIPAGDAGPAAVMYHHVLGVTNGPNKEEAFKFVEWLLFGKGEETGLTPLVHSTATRMNVPVQRDALELFPEYYDIRWQVMLDFMQNMEYATSVLRYIGRGGNVDAPGQILMAVLNGTAPQQAINDAIIDMQAQMEDWRKEVLDRQQ